MGANALVCNKWKIIKSRTASVDGFNPGEGVEPSARVIITNEANEVST